MSFLEMLDIVNEEQMKQGKEGFAFDHDCREGICGMCSLVINGMPHGPDHATTTCQLHMRKFKDGDTIVIEPWRAAAFPVIRDCAVDRTAFDRIIAAGQYYIVISDRHREVILKDRLTHGKQRQSAVSPFISVHDPHVVISARYELLDDHSPGISCSISVCSSFFQLGVFIDNECLLLTFERMCIVIISVIRLEHKRQTEWKVRDIRPLDQDCSRIRDPCLLTVVVESDLGIHRIDFFIFRADRYIYRVESVFYDSKETGIAVSA